MKKTFRKKPNNRDTDMATSGDPIQRKSGAVYARGPGNTGENKEQDDNETQVLKSRVGKKGGKMETGSGT